MTTEEQQASIKAALGAEKFGYAYLDLDDECWFVVNQRGLVVWSQGQLHMERAEAPASLPLARHVFFHTDEEVWAELTEYVEGGRLVCAADNGPSFQRVVPVEEIPERCAYYEGLGFRKVNPWNMAVDTILWREYRNAEREKVVVSVDGTDWSGRDHGTCASRAEAEAAAEQQVVGLLADGFRLVLMEQWEASEPNPPVASEVPPPELRSYPTPQTAQEAVDQAVERLTELHERVPVAHLVVERIGLPDDLPRLESMGYGHFPEWYPERVGRWNTPGDAAGAENSFDYFVRKYGTLTWCVRSGSPLRSFYCGNVSGGGWSPLEIHPDDYDCMEELAEEHEQPDYLKLRVFHGGWHHGQSFAFDTRFTSPEGEHPIVRFDECEPELPDGPPERVLPFGFWLLRRVERMIDKVLPWLARFQGSATS